MDQMKSTRRQMNSLLVFALLMGVSGSSCRQWPVLSLGANNTTRQTSNPASTRWAQPLTLPGLPNLHKVSDDLYRGAQPTTEGIEQLDALGIKTIINLRSSDTDRDILDKAGPTYERIPMVAWNAEDEDVVRFLQIIADETRLPAFVHCRRGADRTGLMVAVYRIVVQGWGKEQATDEMTRGGFRFYSGWQNLVRYIRDLDVDAIRRRAGLSERTTPN
ncbi:MAG TPA: tyrosine-protein phosphatase [Sedimentisphaerales bacterium]|jgi:protein tyrosine/serine phosphatase|nr:tyrosine-protein phosphatase [Sedimentisphaerales bacterium]HNU27952.1 tyrosine-protein phosphatase [Sedimentisphaerales bacterium]